MQSTSVGQAVVEPKYRSCVSPRIFTYVVLPRHMCKQEAGHVLKYVTRVQ